MSDLRRKSYPELVNKSTDHLSVGDILNALAKEGVEIKSLEYDDFSKASKKIFLSHDCSLPLVKAGSFKAKMFSREDFHKGKMEYLSSDKHMLEEILHNVKQLKRDVDSIKCHLSQRDFLQSTH